jgi:hypothetical protein
MYKSGGRALDEIWVLRDTNFNQTPNTRCLEHTSQTMGAKLHWSKGKQPRPSIKVPKSMLSVKRGDNSYTTRRLA